MYIEDYGETFKLTIGKWRWLRIGAMSRPQAKTTYHNEAHYIAGRTALIDFLTEHNLYGKPFCVISIDYFKHGRRLTSPPVRMNSTLGFPSRFRFKYIMLPFILGIFRGVAKIDDWTDSFEKWLAIEGFAQRRIIKLGKWLSG